MKNNVFIIETDEKELREMLCIWLTDAGFQVSYGEEHAATDKDTRLLHIIDRETRDRAPDGKDTLVLCRVGEIPSSERSLKRPFSRIDFINAVRQMSSPVAGKFRFDDEKRRVIYMGTSVPLTEKEYKIFRLLYNNSNSAIPRERIAEIAKRGQHETNAVDVYICRLRQKLLRLTGINPVKTVRKNGYMFSLDNNIRESEK